MHLIQLDISLTSFKLRLALKLKGLDLPLHDPPGGTYRSDAFRAINPAGTIPTLVDGNFWLAESDAIIDYLDDIGAGQPLRPDNPRDAARARMVSRWIDFRIDAPIRRLFAHVAPAGRDAAVVRAISDDLGAGLGLIEKGLDSHGPFCCGARPSIADCGLLACGVWLEALSDPLSLAASPGERFARVAIAMGAAPALADDVVAYRRLVEGWVAARSRAQPA